MPWIAGNYYLSQAEMENNATIILNEFKGYGWADKSIAALLGNMQEESTINPQLWENLTEDNSRGYGLTQWTPATKLKDWCNQNNFDYTDGTAQLNRIVYELHNKLQWFRNPEAPIPDPPVTMQEWAYSETLTLKERTNYFLWYYEHPGETIQPQRYENARIWYRFITGTEPEPEPEPKKAKKLPFYFYLKGGIRKWY